MSEELKANLKDFDNIGNKVLLPTQIYRARPRRTNQRSDVIYTSAHDNASLRRGIIHQRTDDFTSCMDEVVASVFRRVRIYGEAGEMTKYIGEKTAADVIRVAIDNQVSRW